MCRPPSTISLDEHRAVTERRGRLALARGNGVVERRQVADDAHATPTAARRCLHQCRHADLGERLDRVVGQHRNARGAHQSFRLDLRSHRRDRRCVAGRSTINPASTTDCANGGVLAEEAVAGMNRIATASERGGDQQVAAQIRIGGSVAGQAATRCRPRGRTARWCRHRRTRRPCRCPAGGRCG